MRHGLLLGTAIAVLLSLSALAADTADFQDSVIIGNIAVDAGQNQAVVPVYFVTHGDITHYNVPLKLQTSSDIRFQGMQVSSALEGWDDNWQGLVANGSEALQMGFADLGGEDNAALNTAGRRIEALKLIFTINEPKEGTTAAITSRVDARSGAAIFGFSDGIHSSNPVIVDGGITLQPTQAADVEQLPTEISLSQNYPNPFNPATEIAFALPEARQVKLAVYNVLGQEVRNLVSGTMEAGYHKVMWDGRNNQGTDVPSGAYFYRLEASNFVQSMKMVLLK